MGLQKIQRAEYILGMPWESPINSRIMEGKQELE
jgi:hypothetical protein